MALYRVNCKTDDGKQINVEMQSRAMDGDSAKAGHENLKGRAIYYLCDLHSSQEGRGADYGELMPSYQIMFCNFTVFPKRKAFLSRFDLRDKSGFMLSDAIGIVFVELPKLTAAMKKPVRDMTSAEIWGIFFGHADDPRRRDLLREMIEAKEEIKMANEILSNISKDEIERAHALSRKKFRMDMQHSLSVARKEGMAKGIEKGREKGREEGWEEGKATAAESIALRMLLKGNLPESVAEYVELPLEKVLLLSERITKN